MKSKIISGAHEPATQRTSPRGLVQLNLDNHVSSVCFREGLFLDESLVYTLGLHLGILFFPSN